jgi:hypothetical protein
MSTEKDGHTHHQDLPAEVDGSRRRFLNSAALAGLADPLLEKAGG